MGDSTAKPEVRKIAGCTLGGERPVRIPYGLRVVAARYYKDRRPPATRFLHVSDSKLGDETALYKKLKDKP